jgi:hypothetical protein
MLCSFAKANDSRPSTSDVTMLEHLEQVFLALWLLGISSPRTGNSMLAHHVEQRAHGSMRVDADHTTCDQMDTQTRIRTGIHG